MRSIITASASFTASRHSSSRARRVARCPPASAWRPAGPHLDAHLREQVDVRAEHAAVQHVADDGHLQASRRLLRSRIVKASSSPAWGARACRRRRSRCACTCGPTVAGPDEAWRQTMRSGSSLEVQRSVDERLALHHARRGDGDVERVRAQPLLRHLERRARCASTARRELMTVLPAAPATFLIGRADTSFIASQCRGRARSPTRSVGDASRSFRGGAQPCRSCRLSFDLVQRDSSRPSISARRTWIVSARRGHVLPT